MTNAIRTIALCAFTLLPLAAHAADKRVQETASRLSACVRDRSAETCRDNMTASSVALFDRFASYNLMDCLPQSATYLSQKPEGAAMLVRATVVTNEKKSVVKLIFQQEEDRWKLDLPETLRRGIGENWEGQVDATEKVYLLLRSQMGDNLNCTMIRNLGAGLTATASK